MYQVATGDSWASGVARPLFSDEDPSVMAFFFLYTIITSVLFCLCTIFPRPKYHQYSGMFLPICHFSLITSVLFGFYTIFPLPEYHQYLGTCLAYKPYFPPLYTISTSVPFACMPCVLQCVAVCCSVLQFVAVCCSVLQCVAVCCNVLPACHFPSVYLQHVLWFPYIPSSSLFSWFCIPWSFFFAVLYTTIICGFPIYHHHHFFLGSVYLDLFVLQPYILLSFFFSYMNPWLYTFITFCGFPIYHHHYCFLGSVHLDLFVWQSCILWGGYD